MKNFLCIIISMLLIISTMGVTAFAENTVTFEGVIYEFDSESQSYTVVGSDLPEDCTYIYLHETINGYNVSKVAPHAFEGTYYYIDNFPSYLTEIGEGAFMSCIFSCPVNFYGDDVTIDSCAFYEACFSDDVCFGDPTVTEQRIKINEYAFYYANFPMITNCITFYGNAVETEPDAFECASTNDIVVYYSMDFMVDSGIELMHYLSLKDVHTIPEGAFGFHDYYYENSYLENIYIDGALSKIEENTFCETQGNVNVYIDDLANWCYNVEFLDNPLTYGGKLYVNNQLLTDLVLPEGGDTVSARAFEDYMYLESLTVPSHIRKISYRSFLNNYNLIDINIAEGLETIEEEGLMFFSDREISLPKSLETIEFIGYWESILMLYCYPDSAAQRYAEENNVPYTLYSMDVKSEDAVIDNENMCIMTSDNGAQDIEEIINVSGYTVKATPSYSANGVELYGTGSVVDIYNNNGEIEGTYTVVVTGDLDGDAVCDVLDVAKAERVANAHETADIAQIYAANGCVSEKIDVSSYQSVVNTALNV